MEPTKSTALALVQGGIQEKIDFCNSSQNRYLILQCCSYLDSRLVGISTNLISKSETSMITTFFIRSYSRLLWSCIAILHAMPNSIIEWHICAPPLTFPILLEYIKSHLNGIVNRRIRCQKQHTRTNTLHHVYQGILIHAMGSTVVADNNGVRLTEII